MSSLSLRGPAAGALFLTALGLYLGLTRAQSPVPARSSDLNSPANAAREDTAAPRNEKPQPLTTRRAQLNLAGAELILAAARAKAQAMKLRVNIFVVDDGGHPLAFARMDDARPGSAYTALTKAVTAATMRAPTGPLPAGAKNPDILLNLSLQNAAAASGGKLTTLHGGVPVEVEKQVIGAVGVGGATGEQDAEIARAGIAALLEALKKGK